VPQSLISISHYLTAFTSQRGTTPSASHQPSPSFACLSPASQPQTTECQPSSIGLASSYPASQPQVRLARSDPSCQLLASQSIQPIHPAIQPRLLHVCFVTKSTCERCFAVPDYELVVAGDNTFLWWAIQNTSSWVIELLALSIALSSLNPWFSDERVSPSWDRRILGTQSWSQRLRKAVKFG
jgi:hypothetical protein